MHALSFAIMFSYYLPAVTPIVWGFTGFVAISHVLLGLHYPTDVVAGVLLGITLVLLSFAIYPTFQITHL